MHLLGHHPLSVHLHDVLSRLLLVSRRLRVFDLALTAREYRPAECDAEDLVAAFVHAARAAYHLPG